jgi:hypothetical protein
MTHGGLRNFGKSQASVDSLAAKSSDVRAMYEEFLSPMSKLFSETFEVEMIGEQKKEK